MELIQQLLIETEPLRKDFINKTKEFALKTYDENQNKLTWKVEEWCDFLGVKPVYEEVVGNKNGEAVKITMARYPKGFHNTEKARKLDNTLKQVYKIKGYTKEQFIEKEIENAQKHYVNSIEKLAYRIKDYNLNESKLKLDTSYIDQNISTTITDGDKTIKAFTILAWGDVQKPHYRYLIKIKK